MTPTSSRLGRPRRGSPVVLVAVLVAVVAALPIAFVVGDAATAGWDAVARLVFRARSAELLWNTARIVAGTVVVTGVIGTATAWLTVRTDLPARRLFAVLAIAPLAIPAFVTAFAWSSLLPSVDGFVGALVVVSFSYSPFVFLPVAAALRGCDPALEEAAAALGLSSWAIFRRVVLPQLRPAALGGLLLVALHLIAEFGAFQLVRFPTLATGVYDQYQTSFAGPAATTMASVLVLVALALLTLELRVRGRAAYARTGSGSARRVATRRLGVWRAPAALVLGAVGSAAVGLPLFAVGRWMVEGASTRFDAGSVLRAAGTTLVLAALAAAVVTVAAVPVVWAAVRRPGWVSGTAERLTYLGTGVPSIVVALALVTLALSVVPGLYQSATMLVVAYGILFLPRAVVTARAGLLQVPTVLEDAAGSLGLGTSATLGRVTAPMTVASLAAGAALVFLGVATELTATLLLSPIGTSTLATEFWSHSVAVEYGAAAPYAGLMILVSAPAAFLLSRVHGR